MEIITSDGEYQILHRDELTFGYRSSIFQDMNLAAIVAQSQSLFDRITWNQREISRKNIWKEGKLTQPLAERTAGSLFRNPSLLGISAAELIERSGLEGFKIGKAMVSNKHANFFINCDGASSQDMLEPVGLVKQTVYRSLE